MIGHRGVAMVSVGSHCGPVSALLIGPQCFPSQQSDIMSISFVPSRGCDNRSDIPDLSVSHIVYAAGRRARRLRSHALDFRVKADVVSAWGLKSGDRVIGHLDNDGVWSIVKVKPNERGYRVRLGKEEGGAAVKHNGRKGCAYFRFSCDEDTAVSVFGDRTLIDYELVEVDANKATFFPVVNIQRRVFQPA